MLLFLLATALLAEDRTLLTAVDGRSRTPAVVAAECDDADELERLLAVVVFDRYQLLRAEGADAYGELGMDIADFDLVYAYPWPGEEDWLIEMVRRFGGPRTSLMIYTVRDGYELL